MIHSALIRRVAFWGIDFVKGWPIAHHIKDLRKAFADPVVGRELAQARLEEFLEYACATTPFYKKFAGAKDLRDFPVIQKRTIKENYDDFFSSAYDKKDLVTTTTSGSYGTPFTFYLTKEKKARQWAEIIFFGRWGRYDVGTRHAYVRVTKAKSPFTLFMQNEVLMSPENMDEDWINQQRQKLLRGGIKSIIGYPSVIAAIGEVCRAKGDGPDAFFLDGVIVTSELLDESTRKNIESVFGCRVVSRYSTEEFGVLAQERPDEHKHVMNLATYVIEVLAMSEDVPTRAGELGRIVVTDFFSHAMPLIRYDTGDLGVLATESSQKNMMPMLERVEGRKIDTVYNVMGTRMSPFAINGALRDMQGVIQFQFIQKTKRDYTIKLVVLPSFGEEPLIRDRLMSLLGDDVQLKIEYISSIPPLPSGKRPYIINEFKRSSKV